MPALAPNPHVAYSFGEAMSSIRQLWIDCINSFEILVPAFTYSFGLTLGTPTIHVDVNMTRVPGIVIYLVFLADGDKSGAKEMVQSPGFDGSIAIVEQGSNTHRTATQDVDSWKACVGVAKKEIYDVYGRGIAAAQVERRVANTHLQIAQSISVTLLVDTMEVVATQEAIYYANNGVPGNVDNVFCAQLPALPLANPSVQGGQDQLDRMAQALEDLTLQGIDISFNHGQSIFSVRSKIVTG